MNTQINRRHQSIRFKRRRAKRKRKMIIFGMLALASLLVLLPSAFLVVRAMGRASLKNKADSQMPQMPILETVLELEKEEETEEGLVYRNGKKYRYNEDIITILCMGIDTTDKMSAEGGKMRTGGQSDANFLLMLDNENKKLSVLAIPRDTMTKIDIYDVLGEYSDTVEEHLALQYAYGDGGTLSCELMVKAVSKLMYQLPINGYVSVNLDAIAPLNDQIGGVTVEIADDHAAWINPDWVKGATVTLYGKDAFDYVKARDTSVDFSAQMRLARQKQYLTAFIGQAIEAVKEDLILPLELYDSVSDYMLTDVALSEITYLATEAVGCTFGEDSFYMLPGENRKGARYDEYHVDDEALYDLILELLYLPVEDGY